MHEKAGVTYLREFTECQEIFQMDSKNIILDFELALMKSLRNVSVHQYFQILF